MEELEEKEGTQGRMPWKAGLKRPGMEWKKGRKELLILEGLKELRT